MSYVSKLGEMDRESAFDLLFALSEVVRNSGTDPDTDEPREYEWSDGMEAINRCFVKAGIEIK